MTETAASPWWADVQHLRPRDDDRGGAPAPRTWADDADFTDALKRDAFADETATAAATGSTAVATAVLDLSDFEDALAAVRDPLPSDGPLPLDFDVDDVDWTPTRRPASEILAELDWQPARRFARAAAELAANRESRFERPAAAAQPAPAAPLPAAAEPARRTITLTGDVDARTAAASVGQGAAPRRQRRPRATPAERLSARPDRIALYAVILGVVLILVAALSAPGAEAAVLGF